MTTNQVQVLWFKEALASPNSYGAFPAHALELKNEMGIILRNAKARYANLKLVYISPRPRAYTANPLDLNPEPFAFETGFADKWLIEDQINGAGNLNYNPLNGPVVAPWLSWGPYTWVDGTVARGDGFTWLCTDLESWAAGKFTATELTNAAIAGYAANPDGDSYANLLEYALGLEPKISDAKAFPTLTRIGGVVTLTYPHLKWAADVTLSLESSSDLTNWVSVATAPVMEDGVIETLSAQSATPPNSARYFRLQAVK